MEVFGPRDKAWSRTTKAAGLVQVLFMLRATHCSCIYSGNHCKDLQSMTHEELEIKVKVLAELLHQLALVQTTWIQRLAKEFPETSQGYRDLLASGKKLEELLIQIRDSGFQ